MTERTSLQELASGYPPAGIVDAAAHQLFLLGAAQGLGEQDDSSIVTVLSPQASRTGPMSRT
jgi:hypothetical protein